MEANKMYLTGSDSTKQIQTKSIGDTFLYNKNIKAYADALTRYIVASEEVDKSSEAMNDIKFLVKKNQITNYLNKVLDNPNVKLMKPAKPMAKAFKVITAKDIKGDHQPKVYVDVSDLFIFENGVYRCRNIDILIAYLISAGNQLIYYSQPARLLMKEGVISYGAQTFSSLITYIVDYLYKISAVTSNRDRCIYLSTMYYQVNLLRKEPEEESTRRLARNLAKISEREEDVINIGINDDMYENIETFIKGIADYLKIPKLTLDAFIEKWLFVFGVGTQFSLELYTSFAEMITNVYCGCYLNNQKTIEKVAGRSLVEVARTIIKVGSESII